MKNLLFTVFILLGINMGYAQKKHDYVINMRNDTIICDLQSSAFGLPYYNLPGKDALTKVNPDSVKEYCFHNENNPHVSIKLVDEKKRKYLVILEKGPLNLYEFSNTTQGGSNPSTGSTGGSYNRTYWYAGKSSDSVYTIKINQPISFNTSKKQRKKALTDLLADNPTLLEKFNKVDDYGFDAIRTVIKEYNLAYTTGKP